jgi:hypothetical protein
MEIKVIIIALAMLGAVSLIIRRMDIHRPGSESTLEAKIDKTASANQEANLTSDEVESREELDDSQAAEVAATWNLLNPP